MLGRHVSRSALFDCLQRKPEIIALSLLGLIGVNRRQSPGLCGNSFTLAAKQYGIPGFRPTIEGRTRRTFSLATIEWQARISRADSGRSEGGAFTWMTTVSNVAELERPVLVVTPELSMKQSQRRRRREVLNRALVLVWQMYLPLREGMRLWLRHRPVRNVSNRIGSAKAWSIP